MLSNSFACWRSEAAISIMKNIRALPGWAKRPDKRSGEGSFISYPLSARGVPWGIRRLTVECQHVNQFESTNVKIRLPQNHGAQAEAQAQVHRHVRFKYCSWSGRSTANTTQYYTIQCVYYIWNSAQSKNNNSGKAWHRNKANYLISKQKPRNENRKREYKRGENINDLVINKMGKLCRVSVKASTRNRFSCYAIIPLVYFVLLKHLYL